MRPLHTLTINCAQSVATGRPRREQDLLAQQRETRPATPEFQLLAPDPGANLPAEVEAALAARHAQQRPDRYFDPIALASLIVT